MQNPWAVQIQLKFFRAAEFNYRVPHNYLNSKFGFQSTKAFEKFSYL